MKLIVNYIQNFLNRSGSYVFVATIISRLFSFLASWIALQLLDNKELGVILFAYSIISFLIPFGGLGLHQSLIRYGAMLSSLEEKNSLFVYVFKKGLLASLVLTLILVIVSFLIPFQFKNTGYYIALLSLTIISFFVFEIIKIQFRLKQDNKSFAFIEIIYNVLLVSCVFVFSFFFQESGYLAALIITPFLTSILFIKKLNINFSSKISSDITNFSFWKYGFYSGLTSVASNLLFIIDLLLIGYLLKDSEMVTTYKYVSLVPFSILFLPRVFIATDFVTFTENIGNKKYIFEYIKSYVLFFIVVSIIFCGFFFLFSEETLALFDAKFSVYSESFLILVFGVCGILIFRGLFGNLLSSIGKIEVNYYITSIALLMNVASNYYLIPLYGIKGAAITSAILMWFTGIFSCIWFLYLYKKTPINE